MNDSAHRSAPAPLGRVLTATILTLSLAASLATAASPPWLTTSPSVPQQAALVCPNADVDFGELTEGSDVENVFLLANRGKTPIRIKRITSSADFAELRLYGRAGEIDLDSDHGAPLLELAPGDKARLWFSTRTAGLEGNIRRKITVVSDDASRPTMTLMISFKVRPAPEPTAKPQPKPPAPRSTPSEQPAGPTQPQPSGPAPRLVVDKTKADFGNVLLGEKVTETVTLQNDGEGDLKVTRIDKSCGCTVPKVIVGDDEVDLAQLNTGKKPVVLAHGEAARMEIQFDSKGQRPGKLHRTITVHTNDPASARVVVNLEVNVVRAYDMDPVNLRFPKVKRHHPETASVTFTTSLLEDLELVEAIPPHPAVKVAWTRLAKGQTDPGTIGFRIDVTIGEEAPVGPIQNPVIIKTNSSKVSEFAIPIYAQVVPEVEFSFLNSRSAAKVDFGIITEKAPVSLDVKITNDNPEIPYLVDQIEVISKYQDHIAAELITEQEGVAYTLRLTIDEDLAARYFRGIVRLYSRHPDLPRKEIPLQGWITR